MNFKLKLLALPVALLISSTQAMNDNFDVLKYDFEAELSTEKKTEVQEVKLTFQDAKNAYWGINNCSQDYAKCLEILKSIAKPTEKKEIGSYETMLKNCTGYVQKLEEAKTSSQEVEQPYFVVKHKGKIVLGALALGLGYVAYKKGAFDKDGFLRNNKVSNFISEKVSNGYAWITGLFSSSDELKYFDPMQDVLSKEQASFYDKLPIETDSNFEDDLDVRIV